MNRLEVDWTRCDGLGLCGRVLPELISPDELGFPVLGRREVPPDLDRSARRAVTTCPRLALRLEPAPVTDRG